jgi:hypothetical protein
MNKLLTLLTCGLLLLAITILPGCESSPQTVAYNTLKSVSDAVDGAMRAAADAHIAGAIDAADWARIAELHSQYRLAFAKAVTAASFDYRAAAPAEVAGLAAELTTVITAFIH